MSSPSTLGAAKAVARAYLQALDDADPATIAPSIRPHVTADLTWRGMHPFDVHTGPDAMAEVFWSPLRTSLSHLQRRMDVFFAGRNMMDDGASVWVAHMGHFIGLFDAPWLGIPATEKLVMLRYAEFFRIDGDRISEIATFVDIPQLMVQAGLQPFAAQTAAQLTQPGPLPHDALLFDDHDPVEGETTLATITYMANTLGQWQSGMPLEDELRLSWHEDMLWWGPTGIGSTYTIPRYALQHAGPFRAAFSNRSKTSHITRIGEGNYGGFFGWPNFSADLTGPIMGLPATDKRGAFRVVDIYRRQGDKLAENWVFIDLLHFWKTQGVDILADLAP